MFDAIGYAIDKIKRRHDDEQENAPLKTVFVILSDGTKDTDSKFYTCDTIKKRIREQIKLGWDFLFFAETDAANFAKSIGIKGSCAVDYQPDESGLEKIFNAMGKFIESVRILPLEKHPTNIWRKELQA